MAQLAQVARGARQIRPQDGVRSSIRPDPYRIGRPEYAHHRAIERHGEVHRSGIVGHAGDRTPHDRRKLRERRLAAKVDGSRRRRDDLGADRALAFRPDQHHHPTAAETVARHFGEFRGAPVLGLPIRSRCHENEAFIRWNAALEQQRIDAGSRSRRDREREISRPGIEPQHRSDTEVAIDRMDIEGRDPDVMCVCDP